MLANITLSFTFLALSIWIKCYLIICFATLKKLLWTVFLKMSLNYRLCYVVFHKLNCTWFFVLADIIFSNNLNVVICFNNLILFSEPVYSLSKEKNNFLRYFLLCQTIATESVRLYFIKTVTEPFLATHLNSHMKNLRFSYWKCSSDQLAVLFPGISKYNLIRL